jgi:aminomethyltransferase
MVQAIGDGFEALRPGQAAVASIFTAKCIVARTEFLGQPAYFIVTGSSYAPIAAERLAERGDKVIRPCGIAALNAVRIEVGDPMMMSEGALEAISPAELDLMDEVDREKDFTGLTPVLEAAASGEGRWLSAIGMKERAIPRAGSAIVDHNNEPVGTLTSGTYSPKMSQGVGLAVIDRMSAFIGNEVGVVMHGRTFQAEVISRPMITGQSASRF